MNTKVTDGRIFVVAAIVITVLGNIVADILSESFPLVGWLVLVGCSLFFGKVTGGRIGSSWLETVWLLLC